MLIKKDAVKNDIITGGLRTPDVYFLLFDSYPGTSFLRNYLQFDNTALDSSLNSRGFHVIANPRSNYNRTAFSLASELSFQHLQGINNDTRLKAKHYNQALLAIQNSVVPEIFINRGYKIYNLSVFELANQQPLYKERFLTTTPQRMLLFNTLIERLRNDILWNFTVGKFATNTFKKIFLIDSTQIISGTLKKRDFTNKVLDSVLNIPADAATQPRFIYAHFYLPHPPYFYQENGETNEPASVLNQAAYFNKHLFLSYLKYTNKKILNTVDSLLKISAKPPVIIIQSDHSSFDYEGCPEIPALTFKNYSAVYFPDRGYENLYDTISNVNTFPIIFNKYFKTNIPMQKDTSTYLQY